MLVPTRLIHYVQLCLESFCAEANGILNKLNLLNQSSKKASEFLGLVLDLSPVDFLWCLQFSYLELDNLSSSEIFLVYHEYERCSAEFAVVCALP